MLRKLFGFSLLVLLSCAVIYAQQTPEPTKKPEKAIKSKVWSFSIGDGSYLGIEAQEITRENYGKYGLREVRGVAVEKVVENSPAAQAGLQAGDVIVKFNGEEVESVRKLTRLISEVAPDHKAQLTVLRGGTETELTATMGKREIPAVFNGNFKLENFPKIEMPKIEMPDLSKLPRIEALPEGQGTFIWKGDGNSFFFGSNRQIGISVSSLTKQLGEYFGVEEGKGLLVSSVREDSPAAKAGLKAGDVIIEAEGKEIKNNRDLVRALNDKKEGAVTLTIIRDRSRQTIQVTPEKMKGDLTPLFEGELSSPKISIAAPQMQVAPYMTVKPATTLSVPAMPGHVL